MLNLHRFKVGQCAYSARCFGDVMDGCTTGTRASVLGQIGDILSQQMNSFSYIKSCIIYLQ